jgi:hypothetical protein
MRRPRTGDTRTETNSVPHGFPLLIIASAPSRAKVRSTMLKKTPGVCPAFSQSVSLR